MGPWGSLAHGYRVGQPGKRGVPGPLNRVRSDDPDQLPQEAASEWALKGE